LHPAGLGVRDQGLGISISLGSNRQSLMNGPRRNFSATGIRPAGLYSSEYQTRERRAGCTPMKAGQSHFRFSFRTTLVILNEVKDLRLFSSVFTMKVGKAEAKPASSCRKYSEKQPQILRRCAPQDDKSIGVLEEI
jgi:hypothetical protein